MHKIRNEGFNRSLKYQSISILIGSFGEWESILECTGGLVDFQDSKKKYKALVNKNEGFNRSLKYQCISILVGREFWLMRKY